MGFLFSWLMGILLSDMVGNSLSMVMGNFLSDLIGNLLSGVMGNSLDIYIRRVPEKDVEKMAGHRALRKEYDHRLGVDFLKNAQPLLDIINSL